MAMTKKTLRMFFLDIQEKGNSALVKKTDIQEIFETIYSTPLEKNKQPSRVVEMDDNVYYLITNRDDEKITSYDNCISGLFVKDRHFNYPYESDILCKLSRLSLQQESNTIAELTYFLVDLDLSLLLWVRNHNVAGFSRLCQYINIVSSFSNSEHTKIELVTLFKNDAHNKLKKSDSVKQLTFKTSSFVDEIISKKGGNIVSQVRLLELLHPESVNNIEIKISFKPKLIATERKDIKQVIARFLGDKRGELDKAQAKVIINDKVDEIDFLNSELFVTEQVTLTGKYTDFKKVFDIMYKHLLDKRSFIIDKYRLKNSGIRP